MKNLKEKPLVLTEYNINLMALTHLLKSDVRLSLDGSTRFNNAAGSIYLYAPSDARLKKLRQSGYVLEKADEDQPLWRLKNRGTVKSVEALS